MENYDFNELLERVQNGETVRLNMGNIKITICEDRLSNYEVDLDCIDLDEMNKSELSDLYDKLENWYDRLEDEEPGDEGSKAYEEWQNLRADIESIMDDIDEFLE